MEDDMQKITNKKKKFDKISFDSIMKLGKELLIKTRSYERLVEYKKELNTFIDKYGETLKYKFEPFEKNIESIEDVATREFNRVNLLYEMKWRLNGYIDKEKKCNELNGESDFLLSDWIDGLVKENEETFESVMSLAADLLAENENTIQSVRLEYEVNEFIQQYVEFLLENIYEMEDVPGKEIERTLLIGKEGEMITEFNRKLTKYISEEK